MMEQDALQMQEGGPLRRAAPSHQRESEGPDTERRAEQGAPRPRPGGSGADSVQEEDDGGRLREVVEREATRLSDDVYSDPHCDPHWRSRPKGGHFSPQGSIQDSDQSFHIHPPDGQSRSVECSQFKTDSQEKLRHTEGAFWTAQRSSNKKRERPKRDVVERNKVTLGRGVSSGGSYVLLHGLQQDRPGAGMEAPKAQRQNEPKKGPRNENPTSPKPEQPPTPLVRAEPGPVLSSQSARAAQSKPETPGLHLSSSSHPVPAPGPRGRDVMLNTASRQCSGTTHADLAFLSVYQQTAPGRFSLVAPQGLKTQVHQQHPETLTEQQQSTAEVKWPSPREEELQAWNPEEVLSGMDSTSSSVVSSAYTVLPPIRDPLTGGGLEPSLVQTVNAASPTCGAPSRCDGYLVQMERQKQLGSKVSYQPYSVRDYKQLNTDIKLQGLGPDSKAIEETKMRRQRLYSDGIRQHNKKISRIPFLPSKGQQDNDKKVPRMKALEYARTISRPSVQSPTKQRMKQRPHPELSPVAGVRDEPRTDTLEVLRKRHEDEKKAVAVFRGVPIV